MRGDFGTACQDVYVLLIHSYRGAFQAGIACITSHAGCEENDRCIAPVIGTKRRRTG